MNEANESSSATITLDAAWQLRADAYERGHFVAEQRAISRARLGLPIERGAEVQAPDQAVTAGSWCYSCEEPMLDGRHDGARAHLIRMGAVET